MTTTQRIFMRYGEHGAVIRIDDFAILEVGLPPRALGLVMEWAEIHGKEILKDWRLAKENKPLFRIDALT